MNPPANAPFVSPQVVTALIRALYGAILSGALTALTTYSTTPPDMKVEVSVIAFATTFLSYMIARGVGEGWIDSNRAANVRDGLAQPLESDIVTPAR